MKHKSSSFIAARLLLLLLLLLSVWLSCSLGSDPQSQRPPLAWLHTPKTASSFCMTIQHIYDEKKFKLLLRKETEDLTAVKWFQGCISLGPYRVTHQWHEPYSHLRKSKYVGMFRESKDRLISAYLDFQHHEGIDDDVFKSAMHTKNTSIMNGFKSFLTAFDMRGCQVLTYMSLYYIRMFILL
jgi:hypothetical protein